MITLSDQPQLNSTWQKSRRFSVSRVKFLTDSKLATFLSSWVELSHIARPDSTQLSWPAECPQRPTPVESSRVTSPDPTQLNSTGQLSVHNARRQLSRVESSRIGWCENLCQQLTKKVCLFVCLFIWQKPSRTNINSSKYRGWNCQKKWQNALCLFNTLGKSSPSEFQQYAWGTI